VNITISEMMMLSSGYYQ